VGGAGLVGQVFAGGSAGEGRLVGRVDQFALDYAALGGVADHDGFGGAVPVVGAGLPRGWGDLAEQVVVELVFRVAEFDRLAGGGAGRRWWGRVFADAAACLFPVDFDAAHVVDVDRDRQGVADDRPLGDRDAGVADRHLGGGQAGRDDDDLDLGAAVDRGRRGGRR
jgi:hypothetical protein